MLNQTGKRLVAYTHQYLNKYILSQSQIKKSIIPLNIYQTWHTKQLPPLMLQNSQQIKQNNPEFNYYLFDL